MSSKPFSAWWIGSYNVSNNVGASVPTDVQFYDPNNVESIISSMVTGINDNIQPDRARSGVIENNRPRADGSFDLGIMNSGVASHLFLIKLTSIHIIVRIQSGRPAWLLEIK
jgi:hypothetical protein